MRPDWLTASVEAAAMEAQMHALPVCQDAPSGSDLAGEQAEIDAERREQIIRRRYRDPDGWTYTRP